MYLIHSIVIFFTLVLITPNRISGADASARCFLEIGRILKEGWSQQDLPNQKKLLVKNLQRWMWCPKNEGGYHYAEWRPNGSSTTKALSLSKDGEIHKYSLELDEFQTFWLRVPRRRGFWADNFPVDISSLKIHYYPHGRAKALTQIQPTTFKLGVETQTEPIQLSVPAQRATLEIQAQSEQIIGKLRKLKKPPRLLVTVGHGAYHMKNFPDEVLLASWRRFNDLPSRDNLLKLIKQYERTWQTFGNSYRD